MDIPEPPPLQPEVYRWQRSPTNPTTVQRLANGTEAWVGIKDANAIGQYDYYLNTTLRIANVPSVSLGELKEKLASALVHVRFQHPEVACSALWQASGPPRPWIQYKPPSDEAEALEWARNTISVNLTTSDGLAVRGEFEKQQREETRINGPKSAISVSTVLVVKVPNENKLLLPGTVIDMLTRFNHIYWDGLSSRAFIGDLLRRLGESWGSENIATHEWGSEVSNLSVPVLDGLKIDLATLGEDFDAARKKFIKSLIGMQNNWMLPVRKTVGIPRTLFYAFTTAQSTAVYQAVKARLGPGYTLTHLGHAATVLALLKMRPLPANVPANQKLIQALPADGRRWLRDELAGKQYGCCQAGAVVEFENLSSWAVNDLEHATIVTKMDKLCRHIKLGYDHWLRNDFQAALDVSKSNFLAELFGSQPTTFSDFSTPTFVSDGLVDRHIPHEISTASGDTLLTIENCVFLLDTYQQDLLVRMESFRGKNTLSFTFNDGFFSAEDAKIFLEYTAEYMLAYAQ